MFWRKLFILRIRGSSITDTAFAETLQLLTLSAGFVECRQHSILVVRRSIVRVSWEQLKLSPDAPRLSQPLERKRKTGLHHMISDLRLEPILLSPIERQGIKCQQEF